MSTSATDAAPGPFAVECPGCLAHVAVARALAGAAAACPLCRAVFLVPTPPVAEPVSSPAADEPLVFAEPPRPGGRGADCKTDAVDHARSAVPADGGELAASPAAINRDGPAELAFREPVKTIETGGTQIELRRLTPEERQARRARRNLVMLVIGAALLVALVVLLGRRPG